MEEPCFDHLVQRWKENEESIMEQPITELEQECEQEQKVVHNRNDQSTGSCHYGDDEFDVDDEVGDASWEEICHACCCHTPEEWAWISVGILCVVTLLYFFLFGLDLLASGAKVMSGCGAGERFGDDTNPVAGLMIGILVTVLLQSSSTSTSIIVSLIGEAITVQQGIYMVMGANIGTSVTSTLVAMGQMGDVDQLERAFTGATVHDMFNFMSVAILLPVEVITGYLDKVTRAMTKDADVRDGETWEGPVKRLVSPLGNRIIISNKKVIKSIASGDNECGDFYPNSCDGSPTYKSCGGKFGLIACDKDHNYCPAFFSEDASASDDKVSGGVVFFIAIMILFTCLVSVVALLQNMLLGLSTRIVFMATDTNGYVSIAIGAGITMLVQSSSITTSTLTPLVGLGALRLEQMYTLTLGANIGTTVTGLLAALVADTIDSLQVALAHLLFNITGILIFYPVPFMRQMPMFAARRLGRATRIWRGFPLLYIILLFVVVPMFFLGISALFQEDTKGFKILGSFIIIAVFLFMFYIIYWCHFMEGREKCASWMAKGERRRVAMRDYPDDIEFIKERVAALIEHSGLDTKEKEIKEQEAEAGQSGQVINEDKEVHHENAE